MTTEEKTEELEQVDHETDSLEKRVDELNGEISKLLLDIQEQRDSFEHNFAPNLKKVRQEIDELREKYDRFINNGETKKADECLDGIKTARANIKKLAKNVLNSSTDFADLHSRSVELCKKASGLCDVATRNSLKARDIDVKASSQSASMSYSVPHHFRQLQAEADKAKKIAEQILSE